MTGDEERRIAQATEDAYLDAATDPASATRGSVALADAAWHEVIACLRARAMHKTAGVENIISRWLATQADA